MPAAQAILIALRARKSLNYHKCRNFMVSSCVATVDKSLALMCNQCCSLPRHPCVILQRLGKHW